MKAIQLTILLAMVLLAFNACAQSKQATNKYKGNKNSLEINNQKLTAAKDVDEVKATISGILSKIEINDKKDQLRGWPKDILVLDDRIQLNIKNQNLAIYYSDLDDYSTEALKVRGTKCILESEKIDFIVTNWTPGNSKMMEQLRQNLIFMKNQSNKKRYDSQLILFEPIAAKYRTLKVKPSVSEEQRKFIVQANSFNQQKMYNKAIELYNKANEMDQSSYPAGYSNLALLYAQISNFDAAIYNMKKYLMLEPDGSDARSAQDKIYEWKRRWVNKELKHNQL